MQGELLDKAVREQLRKKDDRKAFLDLVLRFLFLAVCGTLSFYCFSKNMYILAIGLLIPYAIGFTFLGTAGISHELFHLSVFSNKNLNRVFYIFFSLLTWNNYAFFDTTHWRHHKHTLSEDDPKDLIKSSLTTLQIIQMLSFDFTSFIRRVRILLLNSNNIVPSGIHTDRLFPPESKHRKNIVIAARWVIIFQFSLFFCFALTKMYWLILLINLAPFILTFPNKILAISQHYGTEGPGNGDFFLSTRTVKLNFLFSFF